MLKKRWLFVSFVSFVAGFILNGLAWIVLPGPELNTILLILGLILMLFGFIMFVISFFGK